MNSLKTVFAVVIACYFTGCVSTWKIADGSPVGNKKHYGITIGTPDKWYIYKGNKETVLTRHGTSLEYIHLTTKKWNDTLSNGFRISETVMLHEIPEILLGEMCATGAAYKFKMRSNSIILLDSFYCSQARYSYTASNTLIMKGIIYSIPFKSHLTVLTYEAEESCYFERSVKDFLQMTSSITINKKNYKALPGIPALKN